MMLISLFCLALIAQYTAGKNPPGCSSDIVDNGPRYPCGFEGITETKCQQIGCCWEEEQCLMWKEQTVMLQSGQRPDDSPIMVNPGFTAEQCSAQVQLVSMGWDWAFSMEGDTCNIYSSRWDVYRTSGRIVLDPDYTSYEQLNWDKAPRGDAEDVGSRLNKLASLYMGCYPAIDTVNGTDYIVDVENNIWDWEGNTVDQCITACRADGYLIAGLQGTKCSCTARTLRRLDAVPDNICDEPCPGNEQQKCGPSSEHNAVYFVPEMRSFTGCFNDTAAIRQWNEWEASEEKTAEDCIAKCSEREDISNRKYFQHYAFVANNGDCFCADQKTILENGLITDPMECYGRCQGDASSRADQYCGMPGVAAVYETHHNLPHRPAWSYTPSDWHRPMMRRLRYDESHIPIESSTMTGIPTHIFTLFPELTTIMSPRLIIHATEAIMAPFEKVRCGADCFDRCGEIFHEDRIEDDRETVKIRAWEINLNEIAGRVGSNVRQVYVYAENVIIDESHDFPFALSVRARYIILDRSKSLYITTDPTAPVLVADHFDKGEKGPPADELFQKQVVGCARILMSITNNQDDITTAFGMLDDTVQDFQYNKEQASFKTAARLTRAQYSGLIRSELRHVPFFTKVYFRSKMQIFYARLENWRELYDKILDRSLAVDKLLEFSEDMVDIFVATNIGQWETLYDAQKLALDISKASYDALYENFTNSRDQMDAAQLEFEKGLEKYKRQQRRQAIFGFIRGLAKVVRGITSGNYKKIAGGLKDFVTTIQNLEETMEFMAKAIEKQEMLMAKLDYLMSIMDDIMENGDLEEMAADVEIIAQLNVMLVGWDNLKYNTAQVLNYDDVQPIEGSQDYLTVTTDTCNWGKAVTATMIEMAENYRRLMTIKAQSQAKIEMSERYEGYIDDTRADNSKKFDLINNMVEMQEDIRMDVNDLLLDYCDLHYYENNQECSSSSQPRFDGNLQQMQLQLLSALEDGLWGSGVPGSTCRQISVQDTNMLPNCTDITECPINVFRNTGLLMFSIPEDFYDFVDIDRYRVGTIDVVVNGAKSPDNGPNDRLKLEIESTAPFGVRNRGEWQYYVTRALKVVHEYDIKTGLVTWTADLYKPEGTNIYHRTPFTEWRMQVSEISSHIILSDVTEVEMIFYGSGVPVFAFNRAEEELQCFKFYQRNPEIKQRDLL